MLSTIKLYLIIACVAVAVAGAGYGLWQARQVRVIQGQLVEAKAALRAEEGARRALSHRLATQAKRAKEESRNVELDTAALATVPDWANARVPDAVRDRLLND